MMNAATEIIFFLPMALLTVGGNKHVTTKEMIFSG
jgi:hypothetical protein